jgi:hypothetical protein
MPFISSHHSHHPTNHDDHRTDETLQNDTILCRKYGETKGGNEQSVNFENPSIHPSINPCSFPASSPCNPKIKRNLTQMKKEKHHQDGNFLKRVAQRIETTSLSS